MEIYYVHGFYLSIFLLQSMLLYFVISLVISKMMLVSLNSVTCNNFNLYTKEQYNLIQKNKIFCVAQK